MKRTDYGSIAAQYDANVARHRIPKDAALADRLATATGQLEALDVACGTGNYLAAQRAAFGDAVRFRGVDASQAMLDRAAAKVPGVELVVGRAESLPYPDASFDYVTSRFAFHHFEDKTRALAEFRRVLRPKGVATIFNADALHMPGWWTFQFFPESSLEDEERYWSSRLLQHRLEELGFDVTVRVEITMRRRAIAELLADAERRDGSELAILDTASYERGLARMRSALAHDPAATIADELALVEARATLR